ncbi:MAG: hypothetical protein H7A53_07585 [Akkermansiaceae bacterium]|nr:hypothetical protein [Akkermansiaceae bacterium]MCP5550735.1 hypothetical protein [Akkermansiaceae bacterium]
MKSVLPTLLILAAVRAHAADPTDIGTRRELFVDDALIESVSGGARLVLHHPEPREIALDHDAPWEGTGSGYHSVFRDGDKYRMYYKAWHLDVKDGKVNTGSHPLYCCYAESDDGIHWRKPELDLVDFKGSKANNIVLAPETFGEVKSDPGHPAVFRDDNPACPPEARYKAIIRAAKPHGLLVFQSPDGLHWSLAHPEPVITEGAFDSQNLAFFDPNIGAYRAYWRVFTEGQTDAENWKPGGVRAIRTAVSKDLVHWEPWKDLTYVDSPKEELYTKGVKPYSRAPHLLIGFPTRYIDRGWSDSMRALPELAAREDRAKASQRYGTAITEGLMMASRDGVNFKRWNEAFLRPGIERDGTWHYGHQYLAWHPVETQSTLEGAPNELSFYATESYWTGKSSVLRRYALRLDGFVSANAPLSGGELVTKPIRFSGKRLALNFSSSAAGGIRVEIQDESGKPLPGFALDDCPEVFGDSLERTVAWKSGTDLSALAGKTVRLRFALRDADLFAYRFAEVP